jgi:hypothetical protein
MWTVGIALAGSIGGTLAIVVVVLNTVLSGDDRGPVRAEFHA